MCIPILWAERADAEPELWLAIPLRDVPRALSILNGLRMDQTYSALAWDDLGSDYRAREKLTTEQVLKLNAKVIGAIFSGPWAIAMACFLAGVAVAGVAIWQGWFLPLAILTGVSIPLLWPYRERADSWGNGALFITIIVFLFALTVIVAKAHAS